MKLAKLKTNKLIKECRNWDQVKLTKQLSFIKNVVDGTTNWPIKIGQKYINKELATKIYNIVNSEYERRYNETMEKCENMRKSQQNDAPVAVVKNPTPNMAEKTESDTSKTAKTNVKKVLHKNRTKTIDKTKKNNYITNTIAGQSRKTKTTTKKRSTMTNNNLTKNSLTKKQLAAFETVYHHIWRTISNTIPMHNKKMRSAGFEQARIETIKLLKKIY